MGTTYIENLRNSGAIVYSSKELKALLAQMPTMPCIASMLRWGTLSCVQIKEGNRVRNYYIVRQ